MRSVRSPRSRRRARAMSTGRSSSRMRSADRPPVAVAQTALQLREIEAAAVTLVGQRRVGEAIANYDPPRIECGPQNFGHVLRARGVDQERFGQRFDRNRAVEKDARVSRFRPACLPARASAARRIPARASGCPERRPACSYHCPRCLRRQRASVEHQTSAVL